MGGPMGIKPLTLSASALSAIHWATRAHKQSSRFDCEITFYFQTTRPPGLSLCLLYVSDLLLFGMVGIEGDGGDDEIQSLFMGLEVNYTANTAAIVNMDPSTTSIKGFKMQELQRDSVLHFIVSHGSKKEAYKIKINIQVLYPVDRGAWQIYKQFQSIFMLLCI